MHRSMCYLNGNECILSNVTDGKLSLIFSYLIAVKVVMLYIVVMACRCQPHIYNVRLLYIESVKH